MDANHARFGLSLALLALLPVGAHALLLGGTEVPKEKVVVYLMIGHSNMAGQDFRNSDGVADARGWNYQWATTKTWVPAKETPGAMRNGLSGRGSGGPSMPFIKMMAAAYPDHWFGVVSNASLSATCRGENTGNNSSGMDPEDNRYWKGARLYNEILNAAKEIQGSVTLGGIVCMLGSVEATRTPESVCRTFSADLAQLAKDFRADLGLPQLPFIMGEYEAGSTGSFSPALPLPAIITAEIKSLPSKLPFSAIIDSKGIAMFDDHHYSAKVGQPEFARRTLAAIQANKWFPPQGGSAIVIRPLGPRQPAAKAAPMRFLADQGILIYAREGRQFLPDGSFHNRERTYAIPSH